MEFGKSVRLPEDTASNTFQCTYTEMWRFKDIRLLTDAINNALGKNTFGHKKFLILQKHHRKTNSTMKSKAYGLGEKNLNNITQNHA